MRPQVKSLRPGEIPKEILVEIGSRWTATLKTCADSWTDSELAKMRCELPMQFHVTPIDELRRRFINLRKQGTPGFSTGKHGGNRRPPPKHLSEEYKAYLLSDEWKRRKQFWLEYWDYSCCLCEDGHRVDVHHRTYERFKRERDNDCVVLCRRCHDAFHEMMDEEKIRPLLGDL